MAARFRQVWVFQAYVAASVLTPALSVAQSSGPTATRTLARQSLMQAERAVAVAVIKAGTAGGLGGALAEDALLLYEGAPIVSGRDQAHRLLSSQASLARLRVRRMPLIVNVSADGNMGVTSGITAISETTQPPDSAFRSGNFISVWRRSAPSEWKIIAHMENGLADSVSVLFPAPPTAHVRTVGGRDYAAADLAFARMAADSGAPVAFGAFAAPDATMISGAGDVLVGPSAIRSRMLDRPAARALWSWSPLYAGGSTGGDLGYTVGEATIRASAADDASVVYSKYLTVWRRQPDGTLRFLTDGGNARPVP